MTMSVLIGDFDLCLVLMNRSISIDFFFTVNVYLFSVRMKSGKHVPIRC